MLDFSLLHVVLFMGAQDCIVRSIYMFYDVFSFVYEGLTRSQM